MHLLAFILFKLLQLCLSMYGLLLPPDINGLSTKDIRIQPLDENCKSQRNLILYFFPIPPRFVHAYL